MKPGTLLLEGRAPDAPAVVIRHYASPPKDAQYAVCLDCESVIGGPNTPWPAANSAHLHRTGTDHTQVYTTRISIEREAQK